MYRGRKRHWAAALLIAPAMAATSARAQDALDRAQPAAEKFAPMPAATPTPRPEVTVEVEAQPAAETEGGAAVLVGAIRIEGLQVLEPADFADILASRVGQTLGPAELSTLANDIAQRARSRGFVFASAAIAPQRLQNGVLTVAIDEGRVDEIRFDGPEQPAVRAALAPLVNGRPARIGDVERRLMIAGDVDGIRIRSSRFVREKGRGVLLVRMTQDRVAVRASLSNEGTKPLGPEQARIDVDLNALFFSDDVFSVTYSTTPAQPRELQFARARYAKRINSGGTELGLVGSGSIARPGAYISSLDIESRTWFVGLDLLQPLRRRRATSLWLEGELGLRDLVQRRGGVRVRHDRIAAARMTLYGYTALAGGRLRVSTTLSQGLGMLGATRFGDPLASRRDADGTFTALTAWSDWTGELADNLSLRLAVQSQLASQPLLITEEAGLGGTGFLRGYDWSERSGDQAAMGMAELRYLLSHPFGAIRRAQLYAFVDGGKVTNLDGGFGSGALASAGGGMRADITSTLGANLELAVPLSGPRYDTGDESSKLNFRIIKSF